MNTKLQHLMHCVSEEAGEIVQVCGKAGRFGMLDINPTTKETNWVELRKEVHDLIAVFEMLCDEFDRVSDIDRALVEKKKNRVRKYMIYAQQQGQLQESSNG